MSDAYKSLVAMGDSIAESNESMIALYRNGDASMLEKIIAKNIRFILDKAKENFCPGISVHEMVSEGVAALIEKVKDYDVSCNTKFLTYAYWRIIGAMKNAVVCKMSHDRMFASTDERIAEDGEGNDMTIEDTLHGDNEVIEKEVDEKFASETKTDKRSIAAVMLKSLSKRERRIVYLYTYKNMTFEEIGEKYGLTKMAIKFAYDKAIGKMQKYRK